MSANLDALEVLRALDGAERAATEAEQRVLARWSSWGAVPQIFDDQREELAPERAELRALVDDDAYAAARRTTVNAHYTDPAYVREIWRTVEQLGFVGGRVLEPGCGSGTFIGMAPPGAEMVGVELDPTTARIAAALYPGARVRAESFADTRFPAAHFDAVVGNVPFADVTLHDPRHNRGRHSMHNHFILKSLQLTRPGGVVAVLTSRFTLDAQNPAARREMNALADLVGAVRLPSGAHRRAAGTEAVTDLLVFRRREADVEPRSTLWETVSARRIGEAVVRVNSYFDQFPQRILGELEVGQGMYSAETLLVRAPLEQTADRLGAAVDEIVAQANRDGLTMSAEPAAAAEARLVAEAPEGLWDGHLIAHADGTFSAVERGLIGDQPVPATQRDELRALLGLRDDGRALLRAEAADAEDTAEIDALRDRLRASYGAYADRWGPINRFGLRNTGRVDPETAEPRLARVAPPVMRIFRGDPFAALVMALESFEDTTQTATPATIMSQRVVAPRQPILGADTAEDALAVTLDQLGRVELAEVARLLGTSEPDARAALGELVFDDPGTEQLVARAEYLSGNVRVKLLGAREAAAGDDRYALNVEALEKVQPAPLGMDEIEARLGAAWIDTDTHRQFLVDILGDETVKVEHPGQAIWDVKGNTYSVAATSQWGTERMPATAIAKAALEQRPIQVFDRVDEHTRVLNPVETAAAQEKAGQLQERFGEWVWEDTERATRLAREYNDRFNAIVLRDYSAEGERLSLPGLARNFDPRPHQREAVARMIAEPSVGLFHVVGAGKTAEMVMGTMELTRLGLVSKPCVVVPNHMLEQFSREWLQLYPQARILAASTADLAGDKRRLFVARAATNDWDAIVMTRTAFERIPVSKATETAYARRELDSLQRMIEHSNGGDGLTVKRLEKKKLAGEEQLQARLDSGEDPGISFEETGIDYLVVDEMHDFKNLHTPSNIRDAAIDGSKRATDLHMKLTSLRERHGDRVITAATATPIANSVTEAHVMQRYLRPDLLEEAGVADFDVWAATFGQTVTEIELAPTGAGYRLQTRFAKFQNVPEMLRMWHVFADVKTAEDLQLPTPELRERPDGQRLAQTVIVPPSPELSAYVQHLGQRAEAIKTRGVPPEEDNMLKVATDGRKAALDMRMVGAGGASTVNKLEVAAERIAAIWKEHRDLGYADALSGEPSATPGALQIVFCDLGTPGPTWNAYAELRRLLARHGVPESKVRYIHEAKNDVEKARLFAAARAGQVAVLLGSTQKMGVGTNVQARAVALHHLDCPWRPADLEQRDGRIMRQGNQNPEIGIYRYVVEGSFDAYSWQTVERKAKFIAQIMRGRLDVREVDDIGDNALSFAEVKALAAGDPLVLEQAQAQSEFARYERLARAHRRQHDSLLAKIASGERMIAQIDGELPLLRTAIERSRDTSAEAFAMTVGERPCPDRTVAAAALQAWTKRRVGDEARWQQVDLGTLGQLGGHTLTARSVPGVFGASPDVVVAVADAPGAETRLSLDTLQAPSVGTVRQLENMITRMPTIERDAVTQRAATVAELAEARAMKDRPFKHTEELHSAKQRLAEVAAKMAEQTTAGPDDGEQQPAVDNEHERAKTAALRAAMYPDTPEAALNDRTSDTTAGTAAQTPRRRDEPTIER